MKYEIAAVAFAILTYGFLEAPASVELLDYLFSGLCVGCLIATFFFISWRFTR